MSQKPQDKLAATKREINYENPSNIVWETDVYGLTTKLKREMFAIASRVSGDPKKLQLLETTLDQLMKHVRARYDHTRANVGKSLEPAFPHPDKDKE